MKKILCFSVATLLLLLSCVQKPGSGDRNNPFDTQGDNWHPPTVTAMADTTVAVNDTIRLHATGTDSVGTVVKFLWARDAKNFKDTCDSVFAIRFTQPGNDTLSVKAMNNEGVLSVKADTVIVHIHLYPPVLTVAPIDTVVGIGDSLRLHAKARDTNGTSVSLFWAMDGKNFSAAAGDSIVKTAFASQGTKTVLVKAMDDDSITTIDTVRIFVKDKAPLIYLPADAAVLQYNSATLKWYPGFYNSSFKVLLDTVNPPLAVALSATRDSSFAASNLALNKKYYWFVIGYNATGAADTSQTWSFTTGNGPAVPSNGLVAYYPFNGNANDESGNGNNGTVNGATLTTDRFGNANNAYSFAGSNNLISINSTSTLDIGNNPNQQETFSAWIKTTAMNPLMSVIVKGRPNSAADFPFNFCIDSGKVYFWRWQDSYPQKRDEAKSNGIICDGQWHSIVYVNENSSIHKIYIDGTIDTINTITWTNQLRSNQEPIRIGHFSNYTYGEFQFIGLIDDVRIYNRALSASEIQALYTEGGYVPPLSKPSLSAWGKDSTDIAVQWNTIPGATSYILQSASSSTGPFSQLYSGADTTYSHTGLTSNQNVWYRVQATNSTQLSEWSDTTRAVASNIPTNGLVAYWPFNGNANDESGNGNNGTVNGATLTSDRFGVQNKAYGFDGISNLITIADAPSLKPPKAFSISVWVHGGADQPGTTGAISSGWGGIVDYSTHWGQNQGFLICRNAADTLNSITAGVPGGGNIGFASHPGVLNNKWRHIMVTCDSATFSIFIDGVSQGEQATSYSSILYETRPIRIGCNWDGNAYMYFKGMIDDIRYYNRALSAAEIQQLYHEGGWTGQ